LYPKDPQGKTKRLPPIQVLNSINLYIRQPNSHPVQVEAASKLFQEIHACWMLKHPNNSFSGSKTQKESVFLGSKKFHVVLSYLS
jgi:hypothetical protein